MIAPSTAEEAVAFGFSPRTPRIEYRLDGVPNGTMADAYCKDGEMVIFQRAATPQEMDRILDAPIRSHNGSVMRQTYREYLASQVPA